jgi:hypothetical protein
MIWNRNSEQTNRAVGKSEEKRGFLRGVFHPEREMELMEVSDQWKV